MLRRMKRLLAVWIAAGLVGCGGGGGTTPVQCPDPKTTYFATTANGNTLGRSCAANGCHAATNPAGGFDMATPGWETTMVGKVAPGGGAGALESKCGGMNRMYLNPGSQPATGLFMDKFKDPPPCGVVMPNIGVQFSSAELACIQEWANGLTK
jgi:hypothetical protein